MSTTSMKPLTIADLAERWSITQDEVRHRVKHFGLAGFNVGTKKAPDWRFRLATVEAWEAQREQELSPEQPAEPTIKAGAPAGWDGTDRLAVKGRRRK